MKQKINNLMLCDDIETSTGIEEDKIIRVKLLIEEYRWYFFKVISKRLVVVLARSIMSSLVGIVSFILSIPFIVITYHLLY